MDFHEIHSAYAVNTELMCCRRVISKIDLYRIQKQRMLVKTPTKILLTRVK